MIHNCYQWIAYWTVALLPSSDTIVAVIKLDANSALTIDMMPTIDRLT